MPEYSASGSIGNTMLLLFKNSNKIKEVIKSSDTDEKTYIFSHSITPLLKKQIQQDQKCAITDDANFLKITAEGSTDVILVPRNDTIYLNLKNIFKKSYEKNATVTILFLNGLFIGFSLLYIEKYLEHHNIVFLFHEVVGYISSSAIILVVAAFIIFLVALMAVFYPPPLFFDAYVSQGMLSPKKNITATFISYLASGLCVVIFFHVLPANDKLNSHSILLLWLSFLLIPIITSLWHFKIVRANPGCFIRILLLNAKFLFQIFVSVFILSKLVPTFFKIQYAAEAITIFLTLLFAFANLSAELGKADIESKYWRFLASSSPIVFVITIVLILFWLPTETDFISSWHLGSYNQSLMVDRDLAKYNSVITQLNYDPKQQSITPWVILQTEKILVVAHDKKSKQIFYFRKYPYNLISTINLVENNK